jgi:hypothetical protein
MNRLITTTAATLAGAAVTLAFAPRDDAGAQDPSIPEQPIVLKVGDRVTIDGREMGCRVARADGHAVMDCRRAGALKGTYGTLLSARRARVVQYRSNTVAKVVFTATHRGGARRCGETT